jgi:hypothetical protein
MPGSWNLLTILLSTRQINVSELNLERQIRLTDWKVCGNKSLHSACTNRDAKFNLELDIFWSTPKLNAPPNKILT